LHTSYHFELLNTHIYTYLSFSRIHPLHSFLISPQASVFNNLINYSINIEVLFMPLNISACEQQQGCNVTEGCGDSASSYRTLETTGSVVGNGGGGTGTVQTQSTGQTQSSAHMTSTLTPIVQQPQQSSSLSVCYASCCAESAKKVLILFNLKSPKLCFD